MSGKCNCFDNAMVPIDPDAPTGEGLSERINRLVEQLHRCAGRRGCRGIATSRLMWRLAARQRIPEPLDDLHCRLDPAHGV